MPETIDVEAQVKGTDMNDDELKAFILANKDRIKELMKSQEAEFADIVKKKNKKVKKKVKKKVEKEKARAEEAVKGITAAMMDSEVQKHFVTMGIEMMMGIEAFMKSVPKPGVIQSVYDSASEVKNEATRTYCEKNPNCQKKKPVTKKIELD